MDNKFIEALSNFTYALEELVEVISDKVESDSNALTEIGTSLSTITQGIEDIKKSNEEILKNQETLMGIANENNKSNKDKDKDKKSGILDKLSKNKEGLKEGVGSIILMATAITAIGLAFSLVGDVDVASVMSISISLPLIAIAFSKVATTIKENGIGLKEVALSSLVMISIATAITTSSYILSQMDRVPFNKMLTGIGISLMFSVISYSIGNLIEGIKGIKPSEIIALPIILVGIATAITASSYILSEMNTIAPAKLFNMVLLGISIGILTTVMMIPMMIIKLTGLKTKEILDGTLAIVAISTAIAISSHILSEGNYSGAPGLEWSFYTASSIVLFTIPLALLGLLSSTIGIQAVALGALSIVIVAGTIALSSHLLSLGKYDDSLNMDWVLAAGLGIALFSIPITLLGLMATSGIGAIAIGLGAAAILVVAGTIMASSLILAKGDYSYGTDMVDWAESTSLLYSSIVPVFPLLAVIPTAWVEDGTEAMVSIATAMVSVSNILSGGRFVGGPTAEWGTGVGQALGGFAPVFEYLSSGSIFDIITGGGPSVEEYSGVMETIAKSIISVADVFDKNKSKFGGAPPPSWGEGVSSSIGAFVPIFKLMFENSGMFTSGEDVINGLVSAMSNISYGIVRVAAIMQWASEQGVTFDNAPTEEFGKSLNSSIKPYIELLRLIEDEDLDEEDILSASNGVNTIADSIVKVANKFSGVDFTSFPSSDWSSGLIDIISIDPVDGDDLESKVDTIEKIAGGVDKLAKSINGLSASINSINGDKLSSLSSLSSSNIIINTINGDLEKGAIGIKSIQENITESEVMVNNDNNEPNQEQDMKITDLYNKLDEMNNQLKSISSNTSRISNMMSDMQSNNISIDH